MAEYNISACFGTKIDLKKAKIKFYYLEHVLQNETSEFT